MAIIVKICHNKQYVAIEFCGRVYYGDCLSMS